MPKGAHGVVRQAEPAPGSTESLDFLQEIAPRQAPLLEALDILSPSLYVWYEAYPDGFDRAVAGFRDKLAWVRDAYPHKLLCPTVWEEFFLGGSWHDRSVGQHCPAQPEGHRYWATVPTYNGKTGRQPAPNRRSAGRSGTVMLEMIFAVGCDGVFYWATRNSWGSISRTPTSLASEACWTWRHVWTAPHLRAITPPPSTWIAGLSRASDRSRCHHVESCGTRS